MKGWETLVESENELKERDERRPKGFVREKRKTVPKY